MELDVATGTARCLNVPGTFTDVHFDVRSRLLFLQRQSYWKGESSMVRPNSQPFGSEDKLGRPGFQVNAKYIGSSTCMFYVSTFTYVASVFPTPFLRVTRSNQNRRATIAF